ncbi:hypothetical protein J6590_050838 [Homalodisca vitripennis]|nr:hypothetical protein J6590_050838 [Homalodisca vitripennis]
MESSTRVCHYTTRKINQVSYSANGQRKHRPGYHGGDNRRIPLQVRTKFSFFAQIPTIGVYLQDRCFSVNRTAISRLRTGLVVESILYLMYTNHIRQLQDWGPFFMRIFINCECLSSSNLNSWNHEEMDLGIMKNHTLTSTTAALNGINLGYTSRKWSLLFPKAYLFLCGERVSCCCLELSFVQNLPMPRLPGILQHLP